MDVTYVLVKFYVTERNESLNDLLESVILSSIPVYGGRQKLTLLHYLKKKSTFKNERYARNRICHGCEVVDRKI